MQRSLTTHPCNKELGNGVSSGYCSIASPEARTWSASDTLIPRLSIRCQAWRRRIARPTFTGWTLRQAHYLVSQAV